jgi:hypothetical protein
MLPINKLILTLKKKVDFSALKTSTTFNLRKRRFSVLMALIKNIIAAMMKTSKTCKLMMKTFKCKDTKIIPAVMRHILKVDLLAGNMIRMLEVETQDKKGSKIKT